MLLQLKDHDKEHQLFLNRTIFSILFIVVMLGILVYRLAYLQVINHDTYTTLSTNNRVSVLPVAPTRGLIFDSQNRIIAENITNFSLEIIPNKIKNIPKTLERISKVITLNEKDKENFLKLSKYKNKYHKIPLKNKLTEQEVAKFATVKHKFMGVEVNASLIRNYPQKELFAHVLGYIGPITEREIDQVDSSNYQATYHIGKTGIEKSYEDKLHGTGGHEQVETDVRGRVVRVLKRNHPEPGKNLQLTIDSALQKAAHDSLGENRGAVVAVNPNNGEILAFVSKPSFDPNSFVQGIDHATYNSLLNSKGRNLFNRATQGQYSPGSTVKPLVSLLALENGVITAKTRIYDPGWFRFNDNDRIHRDWKRTGHGWTNLEKALAESCDTYYYSIANTIGIDALSENFRKFGLGKKTDIDLNGEMSGLVPTKEWKRRNKEQSWFPGDTINTVIGQGYMLVTPAQMAYATSKIANRGKGYQLRLIKSDTPYTPLDAVEASDEHWNEVISGMRKAVRSPHGTAYRIGLGLDIDIAAKTGTTQVFSLKEDEEYDGDSTEEFLRDHSWMIAFAPIKNPKIAVAVLVENNKGSWKVAKDVIKAHLQKDS